MFKFETKILKSNQKFCIRAIFFLGIFGLLFNNGQSFTLGISNLSETIDVHGVCKKALAPSSNKNYFVPTKTSSEWEAFRNYLPSGVSLESCSLPYVGRTESEAISLAELRNEPFRVVKRDGRSLLVTMDQVYGRVDASVENGIVVSHSNVSSSSYMGLTESEAVSFAKSRNERFRVVKRDGRSLMVTSDSRPGRINATITNGVVTSYSVESGWGVGGGTGGGIFQIR